MKNKKTASLLSIFLGFLGIQRFYLGQNVLGVITIIVSFFPIGFIESIPLGFFITVPIGIIQGLIWNSNSENEFNNKFGISKTNTTQTVVESSSAFINSNLNKAKKYTQLKISKSYLTGCTWILASESENIQYIFRENNELLISKNGLVEKKSYELIIDNNSLLLSDNSKTQLYNIVLVQNDFLFLNKVSENKILKFANQTKFKDSIKSEFIKLANELEFEKNKKVG